MQPEMRDFTALLTLPPDTSLLRGDLPRNLAFSGLFRPTGKYADAMPCPCGCGGIAAIEEGDDRLTSCALCPSGGIYDVSKDSLELFALDEPGLRSLVSRELGCGNGSGVMRGGGLFDLGTMDTPLDKVRRKVYFCQRLDEAVKAALPDDRSSLLVVGSEYHSLPSGWFDGRILDFGEFFLLDGDAVRLDRDLLCGHFGGGLTSAMKPKRKGTRKDGMKTRIANIKKELKAHLKSAFDAYWHETSDGTSAMKLLPRPSLTHLCGILKSKYGDNESLNVSTVQRTVDAALTVGNESYDAEFKILWEGCENISFINEYVTKHKGR
ncbi:MAG: hypothetical protein ACI4WT_10495 [Oligosphaeraceae bacterium]